jgi:hypothetical protein
VNNAGEKPLPDRGLTPGRQHADTGRAAEARSTLAALDTSVFAGEGRSTRAGHRLRFAAAVSGLFDDRLRVAPDGDLRPWGLSAMAEEAEFDGHIEAAAIAIADAFTLQVHLNIAGRKDAFRDWVERVRTAHWPARDPGAFIGACASLIGALAAYRFVGFSPMLGNQPDEAAVVTKYPNETTALAVGAGVYLTAVEHLVDRPRGQVGAMALETAAIGLRKRPDDTAARFRELMGLPNPWP